MRSAFFGCLYFLFLYSANAAAWVYPAGDAGGTQFSALDQITPANVDDLVQAWSYHTGELPEYEYRKGGAAPSLQVTPLKLPQEAGGHLVLCTPHNKVVALDPGSGETRWRYDAQPDLATKTQFKCRGLAFWRDESATVGAACEYRLFMATVDRRIIALDARSGELCKQFGQAGVAMLYGSDPDAKTPELVFSTSSPVVVNGVLVVGSQVQDFSIANAPRGTVKAIDARTGEQLWHFEPIPTDDNDPAASTWPEDRLEVSGAANAWAPLSVDEKRDMVFVPTGAPSPDFYGVARPGDNLYANSLVALKGSTGEVLWYFQFVHHDLWDYDTPAQPTLFSLRRGRDTIPAVAQVTKQGMVFLFNRETGEPLFPIEERPVAPSSITGEKASPTQPFTVAPPPLVNQHVTASDAWGVVPFYDKPACAEKIESLRNEGIFTPVGLEPTMYAPSAVGGMNWGGAAVDETRGILVTNANTLPFTAQLIPIEEATSSGHATQAGTVKTAMAGTPYALEVAPLLSPLGLPCVAPPWGKLVAIDLARGDVLWEVPLGSVHDMGPVAVPFEINWGTPNLGGPLVTSSGLVFIGATTDKRFRAFNLADGETLWSVPVPADANAIPMTYMHEGKQYVVVAAGGHPMLGRPIDDAVVAFALPE